MRIYILILISLNVSCVFGQPASSPVPSAKETVEEYKGRYIQWIESVPADELAWNKLHAIDELWGQEARDIGLAVSTQDEDWAAIAEFVRTHQEMILQIRSNAQREYLGLPSSELFDELEEEQFPPVMRMLLPHLRMIYSQTKLLTIDALIADMDSDHGRVLADIQAIRELQGLIFVINSTIEQLVEVGSTNAIAQTLLSNQIDLSDWSQEELDQLSLLFQSSDHQTKLARVISHERWFVQDLLDWLYVDAEDGEMSLAGAKRFVNFTRQLSMVDSGIGESGEYDESYVFARARTIRSQFRPLQDQVVLADRIFQLVHEEMNTPAYETESFQSAELIEKMMNLEYAPAVIIVPELSGFYRRFVEVNGVDSATALLIALHRHHRRHGSFPAAISDLDKDLLQVTIGDPYSGMPLRCTLVDGKPLIYSLGPDRDDDHGKPILDKDGNPEYQPRFLTLDELDARNETDPASIDGDWILYPVER